MKSSRYNLNFHFQNITRFFNEFYLSVGNYEYNLQIGIYEKLRLIRKGLVVPNRIVIPNKVSTLHKTMFLPFLPLPLVSRVRPVVQDDPMVLKALQLQHHLVDLCHLEVQMDL